MSAPSDKEVELIEGDKRHYLESLKQLGPTPDAAELRHFSIGFGLNMYWHGADIQETEVEAKRILADAHVHAPDVADGRPDTLVDEMVGLARAGWYGFKDD